MLSVLRQEYNTTRSDQDKPSAAAQASHPVPRSPSQHKGRVQYSLCGTSVLISVPDTLSHYVPRPPPQQTKGIAPMCIASEIKA
eukprot:3575733-Rhodomonas_salina.1